MYKALGFGCYWLQSHKVGTVVFSKTKAFDRDTGWGSLFVFSLSVIYLKHKKCLVNEECISIIVALQNYVYT